MTNYLLPNPTPTPLEGDALLDFIQAWIVGITNIDGTLVRPRWQPEPANIPSETVTWIAFGITKNIPDTFLTEVHEDTGVGYNEIHRHEVIHFLASIYGPNNDYYGGMLKDGMQVSQNREILSLNNMGLVETGDLINVNELVKEKWYLRKDLTFSIKRQIIRVYQVPSIELADITLDYIKTNEVIQGVSS